MNGPPVTIVIDGTAVAKGRPRMTRRGFAYTPAATRKYEAHGRLAAQLAMNGRPIALPPRMVALVELPIPVSWSKRRRAVAITGDIRPTSRPDLDNFIKAAADAVSGIVVADDSLIVELDARKRYGSDPKVVLTIVPLPALASNGRAAA
jgi:Holliday junction resolvase RusA-like endonuclease